MHAPHAAWSSQMQDTETSAPLLSLFLLGRTLPATSHRDPLRSAPAASHDLVTLGRLGVLSPHI